MKRVGLLMLGVLVLSVSGCGSEEALPELRGRSKFRPSFLGGGTKARSLQKSYECPEQKDSVKRSQGTMRERMIEQECFDTQSDQENRNRNAVAPNVNTPR